MKPTPASLLVASISFLALIISGAQARGSDPIVVSRNGTILDGGVPVSSGSIGAVTLNPFSFAPPTDLSTALPNELLASVATPEKPGAVSQLSLPLRSPDFSGRLAFSHPTKDVTTPQGGMLPIVRWFAALVWAVFIFWDLRKRIIPSFE